MTLMEAGPLSEVAFDFTGRTVLVTGPARGIGLELARRFQDSGASTSSWTWTVTRCIAPPRSSGRAD